MSMRRKEEEEDEDEDERIRMRMDEAELEEAERRQHREDAEMDQLTREERGGFSGWIDRLMGYSLFAAGGGTDREDDEAEEEEEEEVKVKRGGNFLDQNASTNKMRPGDATTMSKEKEEAQPKAEGKDENVTGKDGERKQADDPTSRGPMKDKGDPQARREKADDNDNDKKKDGGDNNYVQGRREEEEMVDMAWMMSVATKVLF